MRNLELRKYTQKVFSFENPEPKLQSLTCLFLFLFDLEICSCLVLYIYEKQYNIKQKTRRLAFDFLEDCDFSPGKNFFPSHHRAMGSDHAQYLKSSNSKSGIPHNFPGVKHD